MPLYSTICYVCQARNAIFRRIADRDDNLPLCCNQPVSRCLEAPAVRPDIPAYESPATGRIITSRTERRDDLARSGCIEWEPGIDRDITRNREHREAREFAQIDQHVDNIVRDLATSGRLTE